MEKVTLSNWFDCGISPAVSLSSHKTFSQRSLMTLSSDSLHYAET